MDKKPIRFTKLVVSAQVMVPGQRYATGTQSVTMAVGTDPETGAEITRTRWANRSWWAQLNGFVIVK